MATYRNVHTSFWQDSFVLDLTPEEKYFYLYLFTNSRTTQCGVYDLPLKVAEIETGYNRETVQKLIDKFITYGKVEYCSSTKEIFLKNWLKYNSSKSPKVLSCIKKELESVKSKTFVKYCIDSLSIDLGEEEEKEQEEEEEQEREEEEIKPPKFNFRNSLLSLCNDTSLVDDFMQVRKNKKATNSQTAFNLLIGKIEASGKTVEEALLICCEKDWKGFDGEWLKDNKNNYSMSQTSKGLAVLAEMRRRANEVDNYGDSNGHGEALLLEAERVPGSGSATENHAGMDKVIDAAAWQTRNRAG